ncbi:MAG: hypothetical protein VR65_11170 [Desulfobulbaceae bacterium BRH_c16a]|nr:MAG: hypothetical protein VR65_11170 [Desulfobulbaceae bacterium BRH_c16a]
MHWPPDCRTDNNNADGERPRFPLLGNWVRLGSRTHPVGLLLSPIIAGAAMSLSSVSVIVNALRLRKVKL